MKSSPFSRTRLAGTHPERGSALITVAILSSAIVLLLGSLINYSLSERRLNTRHAARIEARNAAEALVEYGASQIRQKYETRATFTLNPNGTDALRMPPTDWWAGSKAITTASDLTQASYPPVSSTNLELIGGTEVAVSTGNSSQYYVDPNDENNADDPLKGKWVNRRDVSVIGRATVIPASGGPPITAYVSQRISVRGAPLFAHAIFYNMDLEIFNGPAMTISGPVHTNGNLYVYPDAQLNFRGNVSVAGNIYKAGKPGDLADGSSAAGRNGTINFLNRAGNLVNLFGIDAVSGAGASFWRDSTGGTGTSGTSYANFAANASQVWSGYLQTSDHNIQNYTPSAIGKYIEDPTPSNGIDNSVNSSRAIIEPPAIPLDSDPGYTAKIEVEKQKYANNAGIYITVTPGTGTISLSSKPLNPDGTIKPNAKQLVLPPGTASSKLVEFKPYTRVANAATQLREYYFDASSRETRTSGGQNQYRFKRGYIPTTTPTTITTYDSAGQATVTPASSTPSVGPAVLENAFSSWSTSSTAPAPPAPATVTVTANTVTSGMFDQHRDKPIDLVELDIAALRDVVTEMQKAKNSRDATKAIAAADPAADFTAEDWNGVVYVDVQGGPTTRVVDESESLVAGTTIAATNPLNTNTALRIVNGTGKVPSFGNGTPGLTIASNTSIYVKGNYNTAVANNTAPSTAGGANPSTDPEANEVPAAFAADAISVLSAGFDDASSYTTKNPAASGPIVVAAAFLTGIAPTNKNNNGRTSGGAHNIIRFLENWAGKNTWFRGSLVSLFESRIFTEPHGITSYYSPPVRTWGFSKLYSQGIYPPGTPKVLSYRRIGFTDLTANEYATIRDSFNWK